jgi:YD repeat-containing protein
MNDDSFSYFDGVGRLYKSVHASAGNATTVTGYDVDGRVASVTNPYYPNDPVYSTKTQYDGLDRPTQITKQDGSVVGFQYNQAAAVSTNSECTLTTDEAGNQQKACNDGLGRLLEADEPGGYTTLYTYDTLGNLLSVSQRGGTTDQTQWRPRNFSYDSLSRLLQATNPESGRITYSYDAPLK